MRKDGLKMEVLKRLEAGGQPKELVDNPTAGKPSMRRVVVAVLGLMDLGMIAMDRPWHYVLSEKGREALKRGTLK